MNNEGCSAKESPITKEANQLSDYLSSLSETIKRLRDTLAPVLRQQEPKQEAAKTLGEQNDGSPHLLNLQELRRRTVKMHHDLLEIIEQIDL